MSLIANLARAYANATPEERERVSREDMQAQLDRYNQLKERRNQLYAEQEARVQAELEAQRQAQQQVQQQARWSWQRRRFEQPNPDTIGQTYIGQPLNQLAQQRINDAQARRDLTNPIIAKYEDLQDISSISPYTAVQYRNSLPWYQQMVTPYTQEYINEVSQDMWNPVQGVRDWYTNYRNKVGNDYKLRNNR